MKPTAPPAPRKPSDTKAQGKPDQPRPSSPLTDKLCSLLEKIQPFPSGD